MPDLCHVKKESCNIITVVHYKVILVINLFTIEHILDIGFFIEVCADIINLRRAGFLFWENITI